VSRVSRVPEVHGAREVNGVQQERRVRRVRRAQLATEVQLARRVRRGSRSLAHGVRRVLTATGEHGARAVRVVRAVLGV